MKFYFKNVALVLSVSILTSCGGGGGGGGGTSPIQALAAVITSFVSGESSVIVDGSVDLTWASSNASSCTASGSWSGTKAVSGSESVPISSVGTNNFVLRCNGEGGNDTKTVVVEGYREIKGITVDGYVSGASVYVDKNSNYLLDSNEDSTTTDNLGMFTIKHSNGVLISLGGQDIDTLTQLDNLMLLRDINGYSESDFLITPITSVDKFLCQTESDVCAGGGGDINNVLGIDASLNIGTFDPVANKGDGGINDYLYEKGNQLTILAIALAKITNNINTTSDTTEDYFKSIAETIDAEYLQTASKVDIETDVFISNALDNVMAAKAFSLEESAKSRTAAALSSVMPLVAVNETSEITTALINFGLNTLQTDIVAIANGTADASLLNSYQNDIFNYIATDQSIESNDLVPNISSVEDIAVTNEDVSISIDVLLNDSYTSSAPVNMSISQPLNGTSLVDGNKVLYTPNQDFNGTDSFTYTINQGTKSSTGTVSITVNSINDFPVINVASIIQAEENQLSVTSINISDADSDPLSLTMYGADSEAFILSSDNVLTFARALDYERDQKIYFLTFSLTDGTETVTKSVTVNLSDVPAAITSPSTISVDENQTSIGTLTISDPDSGQISFTISGDDSESVRVNRDGVIAFITAPDYETKTSYSFSITVSDGVNTSTTAFIININDLDDVFTDISGYKVPTSIDVIETKE